MAENRAHGEWVDIPGGLQKRVIRPSAAGIAATLTARQIWWLRRIPGHSYTGADTKVLRNLVHKGLATEMRQPDEDVGYRLGRRFNPTSFGREVAEWAREATP